MEFSLFETYILIGALCWTMSFPVLYHRQKKGGGLLFVIFAIGLVLSALFWVLIPLYFIQKALDKEILKENKEEVKPVVFLPPINKKSPQLVYNKKKKTYIIGH